MRAYGHAPYPACTWKCIPRHCKSPNKGARLHSDENGLLLDDGGGSGERSVRCIRPLGRSCYTLRYPHTNARYGQLLHGPQRTCTSFRTHKAFGTGVIPHRSGLPSDRLCRESDLAWNSVGRSRPYHIARNICCRHSCAPERAFGVQTSCTACRSCEPHTLRRTFSWSNSLPIARASVVSRTHCGICRSMAWHLDLNLCLWHPAECRRRRKECSALRLECP